MTAPDTFAMLSLQCKMYADGNEHWWIRKPVWNVDLTIPDWLLKSADVDRDAPDEFNHKQGE